MRLVRKPFLIPKKEVYDYHRCPNQVVIKILFEQTELNEYLYHDYYYHPIHAGRLECICWRLSSDAGQCGFPDEGLSSLCCVSLFAKAGCGESVTFEGFSKRLLDLSKTYSSFKTVWIPNNMIL